MILTAEEGAPSNGLCPLPLAWSRTLTMSVSGNDAWYRPMSQCPQFPYGQHYPECLLSHTPLTVSLRPKKATSLCLHPAFPIRCLR